MASICLGLNMLKVRLLSISEYCDPPNEESGHVAQVCEHCNDRKTSAKKVSEMSGELFFSIFVRVRTDLFHWPLRRYGSNFNS